MIALWLRRFEKNSSDAGRDVVHRIGAEAIFGKERATLQVWRA